MHFHLFQLRNRLPHYTVSDSQLHLMSNNITANHNLLAYKNQKRVLEIRNFDKYDNLTESNSRKPSQQSDLAKLKNFDNDWRVVSTLF